MNLISTLENMMLVGAEWILYFLIILSVVIFAIAIERWVYFKKTQTNFKSFSAWLSKSLLESNFEEIQKICVQKHTPEATLVVAALTLKNQGSDALEHHLNLVINNLKHDMDRGILAIGTVGSNAPFIGLLGTVFGVIQAFHQLSITGAGGNSAVMSGISEALVATGVGLLVAIPAVVLFNTFQRIVKTRVSNLEALKSLLVANTKHQEHLSHN